MTDKILLALCVLSAALQLPLVFADGNSSALCAFMGWMVAAIGVHRVVLVRGHWG